MAGGLSQSNIPGNGRLEDQTAVEASQIGSHRWCKIRAFVVHSEEQPLDLQLGVNHPAQARQRIEQLGHTLKSVVLALDRDEE